MKEPERVIVYMEELSRYGVSFSLDDFGTGYSSMQYLKRLPISQLKIDRIFISDIEADGVDVAIVKATLDMAENLGVMTVAEGVENKKQLDKLYALGCDRVQGCYFTKPLPLRSLKKWISNYIS